MVLFWLFFTWPSELLWTSVLLSQGMGWSTAGTSLWHPGTGCGLGGSQPGVAAQRDVGCGIWLLLLAWGQALLETFPAPGAVVRAGAITQASRDIAGTGTASRYLVFPMCSGLMVSILAASQSYRRNNEPGDQGDEASSFRSSVPLVPCPQRTGTFLLSPCSGTGRQAGRQAR